MAITTSDVLIRGSGGSGETNVNNWIGGAISNTALVDNTLNNLFSDVTGSQSLAGLTRYRMVYILNNHGSLTMKNVRVYVSTNSTSTTEELDIGLAAAGLNATETAIANETTTPASVTFSHPTTYAGGLAPADIPAGQRYGVWVREVVDAGTAAKDNNTTVIKVDCDTNE